MTDLNELLARRSPLLGLRWETVAWACILVVAFLVRVGGLGATLLDYEESSVAVSALHLAGGEPLDMPGGGLLAYATGFLFFLFGANDVVARIAPFLAGIALVLLPLTLRQEFGTGKALCGGALLAASPVLVANSARLDSASLVACLTLCVVVALVKLGLGTSRKWSLLGGIALGLLLVSGPHSLPAFLGIAVFWWWAGLRGSIDNRDLGLMLGTAVVSAVLATTGLLSNVGGIGSGFAEQWGQWVLGFGQISPLSAFVSLLYVLVILEPLALTLGLAGLRAEWRSGAWGRGFVAWFVADVLISLGGHANAPAMVALWVLPLCLIGCSPLGAILNRLVVAWQDRGSWLTILGVVCWLLWLIVFAIGHVNRPNPYVPQLVAVVPVVLTVAALAAFYLGYGRKRFATGGLLAIVFVFAGLAAHNASLMSASSVGLSRSAHVVADVRTLAGDIADTVEAFRWQGKSVEVVVDSTLEKPLAWHLRAVDPVFAKGATDADQLVVAPTNASAPSWRFVAQKYSLEADDGPVAEGLGQWWFRYFYREPAGAREIREVALYVRS